MANTKVRWSSATRMQLRTPSRLESMAHSGLLAGYGAMLVLVFLGTTQQGLWEDGYFVKRFAHNFWRHGSFSWNPSDGPIYGMTSQLLQLLGTFVYAIAPLHNVLLLKACLYGAAMATLLTIRRALRTQGLAQGAIVPAV